MFKAIGLESDYAMRCRVENEEGLMPVTDAGLFNEDGILVKMPQIPQDKDFFVSIILQSGDRHLFACENLKDVADLVRAAEIVARKEGKDRPDVKYYFGEVPAIIKYYNYIIPV